MECLEIRDLTFTYPGAASPALRDVSFRVEAGSFVTLAGTSGSGKSTLLRQIKSALAPHGTREGRILFEGTPIDSVDLRTQTERIGFVMQDPESQIVTDKVWHELAFGLESLGLDTPSIRRRVAEMASYFGISSWFHRDVRTLSGGQKQLLCLASVMAMQPSLLLLDEPTAQLDPVAASDFLETVARINRELGTTVLITEQRLEEVLPLSDAAVVLDEGRVIASGTPGEAGEALRSARHGLFAAMPAPMRIYAAVPRFGSCPVTVREGRAWLGSYREARGLGEVPPEVLPPRGDTPALEYRDVWFRYEKEEPDVLRGLSLQAYPGEILALLGANGAGKSTAFALAAGTQRPYRGKVLVCGAPPAGTKPAERIAAAVLPQDARTLFLRKTVREDLEDAAGTDTSAQARIAEVSARCGVEKLLDRHPFDLSGGECQRAALALLLLRSPSVLLLDEPTKGLDGAFKEEFAAILRGLAEEGVCVVLVSHDIEFCARHAHRCALLFDGSIASEGTPRTFFGGNSFYTTSANRMARGLLPDAVTAEDVIAACGGTAGDSDLTPPVRRNRDDTPERRGREDAETGLPPRAEPGLKPRSAGKLRAALTALTLLVLIPLTIWIGIRFFGDRKYLAISFLILLEAMLPFALLFERRRPQARELVVIAVLCGIGVAGRAAFAALPSFKPVAAIVILSGVALGCETGFLVGAVTMLASNVFFGQGPWTPWQMFAMGLLGLLAGLVFSGRGTETGKLPLCVFGATVVFVLYGGIMNPASVLMFQSRPTWEMILTAYATGVPVDAVHAGATALFLWLFTRPFLEKIERVRVKYGLLS